MIINIKISFHDVAWCLSKTSGSFILVLSKAAVISKIIAVKYAVIYHGNSRSIYTLLFFYIFSLHQVKFNLIEFYVTDQYKISPNRLW